VKLLETVKSDAGRGSDRVAPAFRPDDPNYRPSASRLTSALEAQEDI